MAKKAAVKKAQIQVKFAKMVEPLKVYKIDRGTTLEDFLEKYNIEYNASIRVNAEVFKKTGKLSAGDIITQVNAVAGGSR